MRIVAVIAATACANGGARANQSSGAVSSRESFRHVLFTDSLSLIRGKRIALLTNQTGVDAAGVSDIDLLVAARRKQPASG